MAAGDRLDGQGAVRGGHQGAKGLQVAQRPALGGDAIRRMEQAIASRGGNPDAGAVVAEDPIVEFENALRRRVPAPPPLLELAPVTELRRLGDVASLPGVASPRDSQYTAP